jgi:hypothetical protein
VLEKVKRHALRRLRTDARQAAERVDQLVDRVDRLRHRR